MTTPAVLPTRYMVQGQLGSALVKWTGLQLTRSAGRSRPAAASHSTRTPTSAIASTQTCIFIYRSPLPVPPSVEHHRVLCGKSSQIGRGVFALVFLMVRLCGIKFSDQRLGKLVDSALGNEIFADGKRVETPLCRPLWPCPRTADARVSCKGRTPSMVQSKTKIWLRAFGDPASSARRQTMWLAISGMATTVAATNTAYNRSATGAANSRSFG